SPRTTPTLGPHGHTAVVWAGTRVGLAVAGDDRPLLRELVVPDGDRGDTEEVTDVAFSPDGSLLVSASEWSRHVKLWDVVGGRIAADFVAGAGGSMRVAFHPGGRLLAVAADRKAVLYEVIRPGVRSAVAPQPYPVWATALSPGGESFACLAGPEPDSGRSEVSCWPVGPVAAQRPGRRVEVKSPYAHSRPAVAFHPDGRGVAYTADAGLEFW